MDVLTGIVIDFQVLSNFCLSCTRALKSLSDDEFKEWLKSHDDYQINREGSAALMELTAAEILGLGSQQLGFCYVTIVSDGDS